ncbi:MAG: hypothetical protein MSC30_19665 [Gaiellaceae bacterium MAG52_C11]|nr:hypothetical protein [Candidatus Gaiellasilicea maunaloa]
MRKLVESTFVTLDGVIENPQNWSGPYWDDEHARYAHDLLFAADALLLGRQTYEVLLRRGHRDQASPSRRVPLLVFPVIAGCGARLLEGIDHRASARGDDEVRLGNRRPHLRSEVTRATRCRCA